MKLYPYQEIGRDFLASSERAYLADEPGMGKTIEAIAALVKVGSKRPLVICPASVVGVWKAEWQLWGDTSVTLSVLSYSKLVADAKYRQAVIQVRPDALVLDEAHYLKNAEAARTAWIIGNGKNTSIIDALGSSLSHVWLLSGTPDPNTPHELHHTLRQLWPHVLKGHGVWRADYWLNLFNWYPGYAPPGSIKPKPMITGMTDIGAQKLKNVLQHIMLRRTMTSVGHELPDLDIRLTPLKLIEPQPGAFKFSEDEDQMSTTRRLLGEAKAPIVAEIIAEELQNDVYEKVVVFAYHRKSLKILREHLQKFGLVYLDGATSESDRTEAVQLFQADKSVRVFLGQQTAGGVGITLTGAANVILVEPSWVPDDNLQAIKRVHRIGQDQHVLARLFTVAGTLDDSIIRTNHRKDSVKKTLANAKADE